jgi:hypothetical protein
MEEHKSISYLLAVGDKCIVALPLLTRWQKDMKIVPRWAFTTKTSSNEQIVSSTSVLTYL